jgi:hypothetical protein
MIDSWTGALIDGDSTTAATFVLVQGRLASCCRRRLLRLLLPRVRRGRRGLVPWIHLRRRYAVLLVHRLLLRGLLLGRPVLVLRGLGRLLRRVRVPRGSRVVLLHGRRHVPARRCIHRRRRAVRRWRRLKVLRLLPVLRRRLLVLRRRLLLRGRRLILRRRLRLRCRGRLQRPIGARRGDHAEQHLSLEQGLRELRVLHHDLPRLRA